MSANVARINSVIRGSVLRRNVTMTVGRQLLVALAQFLLVVLIARKLGPVGNGQYAMAILLPTLLVNLLNLGVGPATVYHVGRGEFSARQASKENLRLGLLVATAGLFLAAPTILIWGDILFPGVPLSLLLVGTVVFPVSLLLAYLNTVLQATEDFRALNFIVLLPPYVTLAGVASSLYLFQTGATGAVIAYLVGQSVGLTAVVTLLARPAHSHPLGKADREHYRIKILSYGWKSHLGNIMAFINYRADIFLVNFFLNPAVTGIYVVAVQIAERLWMLSKAASIVLLPRMSAMHEDPSARSALTRKSFFVVSGLTAFSGILTAVGLYWILGPILGQEYEKAFPAFICLLPGIIALAGARVQATCIAAAGKPEWNTYVAIVVLSVNLLGNIMLIPAYGIIGAACATSGAYLINAIAKQYLVRKTKDMPR